MSRRSSPLANLFRVGLAASVVWWLLPDKVASVLVNREVPTEVTMSRASTVYVLDRQAWTAFTVPVSQSRVKLVSNAAIPAASYMSQDASCEYTLGLEVVGASGDVLRRQSLALRAGVLTYREPESGELFPAQAYLGVGSIPLSSRTTIINLDDLDDVPLRIRLRQESQDPRVTDVAVRAYVQERPPQYKLRYLWQRLPEEKKKRLARANVHAIELLSDTEKRNLLENRSVALAPQGLRASDYWDRKLYSLSDTSGVDLHGSILPRGLYVGPDMLGSIPVPQDASCLRLELQAVDRSAPGGVVELTFHERGGAQPRVVTLELDAPQRTDLVECAGGMLEVEASAGTVVRAYVEDRGTSIEISPEAQRVATYLLLPEAPVRFAVVRRDEGFAALRVDVRKLLDPVLDPGMRPAIARYELQDANGVVLRSGLLAHSEPPSRHDRVRGALKGSQVTEPSHHYFRIPPGCSSLLLYSFSRDVCVNALTRPDGLPRTVRVPEDYLAFERGQDESRDWFPVRPTNHAECLQGERELFVRVQARPPGADGLLADGYEGRSCVPENAVETYKLMASATAQPGIPRAAGAAYFVRLLPGERVTVDIGGGLASPWVQPRLLCLKGTNQAAGLTLRVDGRVHARWTTASALNEWLVPALDAGRHELQLDAEEDCEVYLNHCEPPALGAYMERTVSILGVTPLRYRVEKRTAGTERLSLRLYATAGDTADHVVRVTVTGPPRREAVPTESWTFAESVYRLRPSEKVLGRLLGTDPGLLAGGEVFLLTLGADVDPGWNDVTVSLEEGPPVFVQAMHIVPGTRELRDFFMDTSGMKREPAALPADE